MIEPRTTEQPHAPAGARRAFGADAGPAGTRVPEYLVDRLIAAIDKQISAQVNAILHHPVFRALEASWRGLRFLVDAVDFRQNCKLAFISISKEALLADFEDSPDVTQSGLYRQVYTAEFGQFGGQPVAAVIADYEFDAGPRDMQLLQYAASVAAMAHAPFIAAAGKDFFGISAWEQLPGLNDLHANFDMPRYARWRSFRESEDARYAALTLPGFLLRLPYGENAMPAGGFNFTEEAFEDGHFCWGNTAFALAARMADSFAKYRWCANIIGPEGGGAVTNLPAYSFTAMRGIQLKSPTRVVISEHKEFELAEEGFIALAVRKGTDVAVFLSANSALKPRPFPKTPSGLTAEMNFKLSTQLPYMMIVNRLGHYVKMIQREGIGRWKERADLHRELNKWISQYVTEMDTPDPLTRSKRPLRMARVEINDVPGDPGWYAAAIYVQPHFKCMGASFTLSLYGKLDKQ